MANVYRRRKNGKYIGSWLLPFEGRDVNLKTKDAAEARRRAVLVTKGKWPPVDAAAEAAVAAAAPGVEDEAPTVDGASAGGRVPVPEMLSGEASPSPAAVPPSEAAVPDVVDPAAAAAAAAAEMNGARVEGEAAATQASEQAKVDAKLDEIMRELGGGPVGGDVLGTVCGMVGDLMLAAERRTIEWGGTWAIRRRGGKGRLEPGDPPEVMRKALAAGLHGYAITWFPNFAARLTPGWAIVLGLGGGGFAMAAGSRVIEPAKPGEGASSVNGAGDGAPAASVPPA